MQLLKKLDFLDILVIDMSTCLNIPSFTTKKIFLKKVYDN
jgi:hypothetical protein